MADGHNGTISHPARLRRHLAQTAGGHSAAARAERSKKHLLARALERPLDRARVLGNNMDYGHTGCVNAVSWAQGGSLLLTGGDDTTVRMWRADPDDGEGGTHPCPLVCTAVVETGHSANIFGAQMLPYSTRIATVALDSQVRVSDVGHAPLGTSGERSIPHATSAANVAVFRCHGGSTKRLLLEDSPDRFLTVSRDGSVRQHDLRVPQHRCRAPGRVGRSARNEPGEGCPPSLVQLDHDLSAIGGSQLAPFQFVVAGESAYGYLFDRRQVGRTLQEEWGRKVDADKMATCVRRFGRRTRARGEMTEYQHVTGARMARSNGHEVLLSYSSDAVYLFSTLDDAEDPRSTSAKEASPATVPPNPKPARIPSELAPLLADLETLDGDDDVQINQQPSITVGGVEEQANSYSAWEDEGSASNDDEDMDGGDDYSSSEEEDDDEPGVGRNPPMHGDVPIIFPRARFAGHANVETVKDVNFVGPYDEYVASGSDDGNFFLYNKSTKKIHGIYEGDGSIVNVIEPHPRLPVIATSGIDTTVKLFTPAQGESTFSRLQNADMVIKRNTDASHRSGARHVDITRLLLGYRIALRQSGAEGEEEEACVNQ